jgi:hypothetical protein
MQNWGKTLITPIDAYCVVKQLECWRLHARRLAARCRRELDRPNEMSLNDLQKLRIDRMLNAGKVTGVRFAEVHNFSRLR